MVSNSITAKSFFDAGESSLSIITESNQISSDETILVGLKFKLNSGWHTYWENPGDAGAGGRERAVPRDDHSNNRNGGHPVRFHRGPLGLQLDGRRDATSTCRGSTSGQTEITIGSSSTGGQAQRGHGRGAHLYSASQTLGCGLAVLRYGGRHQHRGGGKPDALGARAGGGQCHQRHQALH